MARTNFSGPVVSDAGFQTTSTVTAGGSTQSIVSGITAAGVATPGIYFGSGAPTISAPQGSLYLSTTGAGAALRAYINSNGTTGWVAVTTAS
jgi:hypothetical protein